MDSDPLFDSAWFKWCHGVAHAKALEADIESFRFHGHHDPLLAIRTEYDAKRHGFGLYAVDVVPTPTHWGLMLGDIAFNYRAALDHLAWALVRRGTTPPDTLTRKQQRRVQFPLGDSRTDFNGSLATNLPGVRRADIAKVRRRQPYRVTSGRSRHYLTILSTLNNLDKHRTLQPIWAQPTRIDIEVMDLQDCAITSMNWPRRPNPLEVGTEITFIRARKMGQKPRLHVETSATAEPSIENRIAVKTWIAQ